MAVNRYKVSTRRKGGAWQRAAAVLLIAALGAYIALGALWFRDAYMGYEGDINDAGEAPAHTPTPAPTSAPARVTRDVTFPEYTFYAIQFGAYDSPEDAQSEAPRYTNRGAAGYVLSNARHRVIGAAYRSRAEADNVKEQLAAQDIESYVYTVSEPELTLRVTGTEAQIAAITGACVKLRALTDELGALAFDVDRGDKDVTDACAGLRSIAARAQETRASLEGELHGAAHPATDGVLSQLAALESACAALYSESAQSAMAFTSKIKYNNIDLMWTHAQYISALAESARETTANNRFAAAPGP